MSTLKHILQQMMNGFEHANAGEYMSMRQKAAHLNTLVNTQTESAKTDANTGKKRRRVALFLGGELPGEVMDYVLQTCQNLKYELNVITFQTENTAHALLKSYRSALANAGINMKLVALTGDPNTRLIRYLKSHPEIEFLACKDIGSLGHSYTNGPNDKNLLPIPVVVVETKQGGGAAKRPGEETQVTADSKIA